MSLKNIYYSSVIWFHKKYELLYLHIYIKSSQFTRIYLIVYWELQIFYTVQIVERTVSILSDLRAAKQAEISALMTRVLNIHPIDVGSFYFFRSSSWKTSIWNICFNSTSAPTRRWTFYKVMYVATASSRRLHFFSDCIFSVLNMV